jgi:hypothetical protein
VSILAPVLDELGLSAANSIAYICGNPDMIVSATRAEAGADARRRVPRGEMSVRRPQGTVPSPAPRLATAHRA